MRLSARRTFIGAAVLMAGIVGLNWTSTEAADPVPESEMKTLFDQDVKNINALIDAGQKKSPGPLARGAPRGVKVNAMMIAYYANSRISGKNADADAKMAALRDTALEVAAAAGKKNFVAAAKPAKLLDLKIAGKGEGKQMTVADMNKKVEMDIDDLMFQFKKAGIGGLDGEAEIKANCKTVKLKPNEISALAARILVVADYCDTITADLDPQKKTKKAWDGFNKDMRTAAMALQVAANGKNAKATQMAFDKVDRACTACHEVMK